MTSDLKEEKELRVILKKEAFDKLEKIKNYHGLKNVAEIVRFLISKEYRDIENKD